MTTPFPYTKLPGRRRGIFVSGSLWLGSDHFLSVKNLRFSEDYKRFYFRDVQAIVIRQTPRLYLPAPWLLAIGMGLAASVWKHWLVPIPAATALWMAFEAAFRSCRCHVQTAVSCEEIPALVRLSDTRRAVSVLSARIVETQGSLPEDWALDPAPTPTVVVPESEPRPLGMWLALTSFLLLLGDAVFTWFYARNLVNKAWQVTGMFLITAEAAIMVFSLVFLRGAKAVRTVRNLVIAGIVFAGGTYYASYNATLIIQAMQQNNTIRAGDPRSFPVMSWIDITNEIGNTALGVAGLAAWGSVRRKMTWPA